MAVVKKKVTREIARLGWVDRGDNHWSKEYVGYIRYTGLSWEAQAWEFGQSWNYSNIEDAVERLEFVARADKKLDELFAEIGV